MLDSSTHVTPLGEAVYPSLNRPETRFDENGIYKVTLKIKKQDASALIKLFDEAIDDSLNRAKEDNKGKSIKLAPKPYNVEGDYALFKFKMKASGVSKKTKQKYEQRPALFDAKKAPLPDDKIVWGGSKLKVAFQLRPYFTPMLGAGVVSQLKAVQVIDLVEGGGGANSVFKEEEGFSVSEASDKNESTEAVQESFDF